MVILHGFPQTFREPNQIHEGLLWLRWLASFGSFGVDLFFVISGYCIAANIYRLSQSELGPWAFLRDRLLRIYPVYWGACLAAIAFGLLASLFSKAPVASILPPNGGAAVANLLLLEPYFGYEGLLLVAWSLTFELAFYVIVAIGFALYRLNVPVSLLLVIAVTMAAFGLVVPVGVTLQFLNAWPEFAIGGVVFAALWMQSRQPGWSRAVIVCIPFGLVALRMMQSLPAGRYGECPDQC